MRLLVLPHAKVVGWPLTPESLRKRLTAEHHQCPELGDALAAEYATDAHHTAYAPDPHAPRRLTRKATDHAPVVMQLVVFDVDCPSAHREHKAASDAWRAVEAPKVRALLEAHPGAVAFDTRGGYRVVALLEVPVAIANGADAAAWSRFYLLQLGYLSRRFGIVADPACKDWQRLYRLPRATRDGGPSPERRAVRGDLRNPGVWRASSDEAADLAELERLAASIPKPWASHARAAAAPTSLPPRAAKPRTQRTPSPVVVADLGALAPLALAAARAIGELPRGCGVRHGARLAVAASLLERGWPRAAVERVLGDIARALGKDASAVVAETVGSTADRIDAGAPVASDGWLKTTAPAVLEALELHAPKESTAASARRELDAIAPPEEVSAEEGAAAVVLALEQARADRALTIVRVTAGAGKSYAAAQHAADAAGRGARTVYAATTHAVARDAVEVLRARGVHASYAMGPLAHRDAAGEPTCKLHAAASSAAEAGVDVLKTICDGVGYPARGGRYRLPMAGGGRNSPCPHKDGCEAYAAARAELKGHVVITVHALLGRAMEWLGEAPEGLVVVDESPALVESHGITADAAHLAAEVFRGEVFAKREGWRVEPLEVLAQGLAAAAPGSSGLVRELLALGGATAAQLAEWTHKARYHQTPEGADVENTAWAPSVGARTRRALLEGGKLSPESVEAARLAAVVTRTLAMQVDGTVPATVAPMGYGPRPNTLELRVALIAEQLVEVVNARGVGRVFLDATADARLVASVLGEAPREVRVAVRDGAPVRRVFLPWGNGTRRGAFARSGGVRWEAVRGPAREAFTLALEGVPRGGRIAVLTWRPLALLLERVWNGETVDPEARALLELFKGAEVTVGFGYFGNLRGQNGWREADGLVVLGSPWPNLSAVQSVARALKLEGAAEDVGRHETRAELEQAVGRIRAPRRTSAAVVVVAASLPPLDADRRWEVRTPRVGRPEAADREQLAELGRTLGVRETARRVGVDKATVQRAGGSLWGGAKLGTEETPKGEFYGELPVASFAPPHERPGESRSTTSAAPSIDRPSPSRAVEVRHPSAGERVTAGGWR
jgi:hypothetical protein